MSSVLLGLQGSGVSLWDGSCGLDDLSLIGCRLCLTFSFYLLQFNLLNFIFLLFSHSFFFLYHFFLFMYLVFCSINPLNDKLVKYMHCEKCRKNREKNISINKNQIFIYIYIEMSILHFSQCGYRKHAKRPLLKLVLKIRFFFSFFLLFFSLFLSSFWSLQDLYRAMNAYFMYVMNLI